MEELAKIFESSLNLTNNVCKEGLKICFWQIKAISQTYELKLVVKKLSVRICTWYFIFSKSSLKTPDRMTVKHDGCSH